MKQRIVALLLLVVGFTGCGRIFGSPPAPRIQQAPRLGCMIKKAAYYDHRDGASYGYSHCDSTSGECVYFIVYLSGPYQGQVFREYAEDAEKRDQRKYYIIRDGKRYDLR